VLIELSAKVELYDNGVKKTFDWFDLKKRIPNHNDIRQITMTIIRKCKPILKQHSYFGVFNQEDYDKLAPTKEEDLESDLKEIIRNLVDAKLLAAKNNTKDLKNEAVAYAVDKGTFHRLDYYLVNSEVDSYLMSVNMIKQVQGEGNTVSWELTNPEQEPTRDTLEVLTNSIFEFNKEELKKKMVEFIHRGVDDKKWLQ
jgi:hypothetical protein